jgi:DNA mismatch repair protein MutL
VNRIQKLSPEIIQQIAAGEIVERPAHMIKELLENSLDANATVIDVEIRDGGKEYVRIADNGHGMSKEDAVTCFEHHATSKLHAIEELQTLTSYGFRGEALSSIASVSDILLTTRTADSSEGTRIHNRGGEIISVSVVAAPVGTEIIITDLFFNTPARKKFLKKTVTELNHIVQLFSAQCLARLSVRYTLSSQGRTVILCPPVTELRERFLALEGTHLHSSLLTLAQKEEQAVTITGVISDATVTSYDRTSFYFFVNSRSIRNSSLLRAVVNGYKKHLPAGKYPRGAIFITIDPQEVDINVHPKKEEVRFLHPRRVETLIEAVVTQTLEQAGVPFFTIKEHTVPLSPFTPLSTLSATSVSLISPVQKSAEWVPSLQYVKQIAEIQQQSSTTQSVGVVASQSPVHAIQEEKNVQSSIMSEEDEQFVGQVIGQFLNTYILASLSQELIIIDQHAAHERILYEQYEKTEDGVMAIALAFPVLITLQATELDLLLSEESLFARCGIRLERFDTMQIIVTATPAHLGGAEVTEIIKSVIPLFHEQAVRDDGLKNRITHHLCAQMACKRAVKAGDSLTFEAMAQLLKNLNRVANRFCCPHGRPTIWRISQSEIEKKFRR